jgi:single-stranded-DNA-specific exonuclease
MAAGFTIAGDQIDEFRRRLNEYAVGILSDEDLGPRETADAELNIDQVCVELVRSLARLEPHGIGNPRPQFLLRDVPLRGVQLLKDTHLKFLLGTGRTTVEALWWNEGKHFEEFRGARTVSLMCRPEVNTWNGIERCQIRVKDAAVGTRT